MMFGNRTLASLLCLFLNPAYPRLFPQLDPETLLLPRSQLRPLEKCACHNPRDYRHLGPT